MFQYVELEPKMIKHSIKIEIYANFEFHCLLFYWDQDLCFVMSVILSPSLHY